MTGQRWVKKCKLIYEPSLKNNDLILCKKLNELTKKHLPVY